MTSVTKWIIGVGVIIAIALLAWSAKNEPKPVDIKEPIKIGAVLPMTGIAANYGEHQGNAIRMAEEEINAAGGINGRPLQLIIEDDGTNPTKTASAMQKLASIDQTPIVIGAVWDFLANAAIPIADAQKVVLISPAAAPDTLERESQYFFTTFPPISLDLGIFKQLLMSRPQKERVVIMVINNSWGLAHLKTFKQAITEEGRHELVQEVILPKFDDNDIQAELTKIKPLKPTVLLTALNLKDPAVLVRKNKELGVNALVVAHNNVVANVYNGELSPQQMEGVITYHLTPPTADFVSKYKAKFNKDPISEADTAYDAVYVAKRALEAATDSNADTIIKALHGITDFQGASGLIDYSKGNYPANKQPILKTFKNGVLQDLKL